MADRQFNLVNRFIFVATLGGLLFGYQCLSIFEKTR
jgi:hypothetical protein